MTASAPAAHNRERLLTALLVLGGVLAALLLGETGVRLTGFGQGEHASARLVDPRWRELLDAYPSNPRGYFDLDLRDPATRERYHSLAPIRYDVVASHTPFAVATRYNRLRFRDVEPAPKPPGVRRVVVVGDSFTEGQGVKEADTLARRLEGLLNRGGGGGWEVRNCGRRGKDFPLLFEGFEAALTLEPDVVVYAMVLNDPVRTPEFQARQTYVNDWILDRGQGGGAPQSRRRWYESRLLAFLRSRIEAYRTARATTRWYLEMYGAANQSGWEQTKGLIREMERRTLLRGGRFVLALWPLLVNTNENYPFAAAHDEIRKFCLSAGVEEVDLLDALRGPLPHDLWVHPVDMHPNELAQRLAAEALAPVLIGKAPVRP